MKPTGRDSSATAHRKRKDVIISRRDIEGQIADGKHIIIFEGRVLKVDAWLKFHPGGEKAIKHMVGRDATDEINAYDIQP
jgi:delta8-fatty-acid desaturase